MRTASCWTTLLLLNLVITSAVTADDLKPGKTLLSHRSPVLSLAFSTDGKYLASMSDDRAVRLWDAAEWKPLAVVDASTTGNGNEGGISVAFSPDDKYLAAPGNRDSALI